MAPDGKSVLHRASDRICLRGRELRRRAAQGIVIMLHEVDDGPEDYGRELATGLMAEFLELIVALLRRDRWDIVTLDEALTRLKH